MSELSAETHLFEKCTFLAYYFQSVKLPSPQNVLNLRSVNLFKGMKLLGEVMAFAISARQKSISNEFMGGRMISTIIVP